MSDKKIQIFLLAFCLCTLIFSQPANTDIWLFKIEKSEKGMVFNNGLNISNRPGYDNQPFFSSDNKNILFSSIREGVQSDIYKYEIKSKKTTRLTSTETSEYSPIITPDGNTISVVMVENDSTQRIWQFSPRVKTGDASYATIDHSVLIAEVDSVGYYSWLNRDSVLYYKLTDPHSLHVYSISEKKDILIGQEPTRSFRLCGFRKFFYILKEETSNELRVYDWSLRKSEVIANTDKSNEDFIWSAEFGFMKSEGSKIFRLDMVSKDWIEWANFSSNGINKITRFTISSDGNWLAIVANE